MKLVYESRVRQRVWCRVPIDHSNVRDDHPNPVVNKVTGMMTGAKPVVKWLTGVPIENLDVCDLVYNRSMPVIILVVSTNGCGLAYPSKISKPVTSFTTGL